MSFEILEELAKFTHDPLGFVHFAFPWGEAGTELENRKGPEAWQVKALTDIGQGVSLGQVVQEAIASGHGVGKSAFMSWIILWSMSTFADTRGVITANTETQLRTKTWVELDKWYRLFIGREFFEKTATKLCSADPEHSESWRFDMVPWSENNTEAFAGLHNQGKRVVVLMDEGSAIPDVIFETSEGALTDANTEIIWVICGNPTRNSGRFKECFPGGRHAASWKTLCVDSRETSLSNKAQIAKWIQAYGEDSDFVRIRVKGMFPRQGSMEFIGEADVAAAIGRELVVHPRDPLVFGVDVARYGDDHSVIYIRKGRDARSIPPLKFNQIDTMTLAGKVVELYNQYRPQAVFVDGGGVGGGVVDRLRQLRVPVFDIQFGAKADRIQLNGDNSLYANKRAEIWGFMREAIKAGLCLPDDQELKAELIAPTYGFNANNEIQLERKQDMKKRGVASPDIADALALTYSYAVLALEPGETVRGDEHIQTEYDPFAEAA